MTFTQSAQLQRVKPAATVAAGQRARALRAEGRDIISLDAGEPDFDTPDNIKEAAIRAIREGKTKYTDPDGIPELKQAIVDKFARENGLTYARDQINVSPGGKPVIYNAMVASLNPGDEVVIPAPYWVSYPDMVLLAGGEPRFAPTTAEERLQALPRGAGGGDHPAHQVADPQLPLQPLRRRLHQAELKALADVLLRHPQVWVLTDDMYEHLIFGDFDFGTIAQVEPALYERTLTMNGVSKAYAMTGWRIGYAGGPKPLIDAMRKVMTQTTSNPVVHLAVGGGGGAERPAGLHQAQRRRVRAPARPGGLHAQPVQGPQPAPRPEGAFYVYPSCAGLIGKTAPSGKPIASDKDFAGELLDSEGVSVVFGEAFGLSPYFRISYATSDALLEDACARIQRFCGGVG